MKYLIISVLILSALGVSLDAIAEQKIVFCGESSSYKKSNKDDQDESKCDAVCSEAPDCNYNGLVNEGWNFVSKMDKSYIGVRTTENYFQGRCECNGTQYVLSRSEKRLKVAPEIDKNNE